MTITFERRPHRDTQDVTFYAKQDGVVVGALITYQDGADGLFVGGIDLRPHLRASGIGTKLYDLARAEACRRGVPFKSDDFRSRFAEAFWRKQARRGRAVCAQRGRGFVNDSPEKELHAQLVQACRRQNWGKGLSWATRCADARLKAMTATLPKPKPHEDDERGRWPCRRWELPVSKCSSGALQGLSGPRWLPKDERQYQHILKRCRASERSKRVCEQMASATVNKHVGARRAARRAPLEGAPWVPLLLLLLPP